MSNKQDIILVDLVTTPDVPGVAMISVDQLQEKSTEAINKAMGTIRGMSDKVMESIKKIKVSERPTTVQVAFGLKLTAEGTALVAKVGGETAITVTLTWENEPYPNPEDPVPVK